MCNNGWFAGWPSFNFSLFWCGSNHKHIHILLKYGSRKERGRRRREKEEMEEEANKKRDTESRARNRVPASNVLRGSSSDGPLNALFYFLSFSWPCLALCCLSVLRGKYVCMYDIQTWHSAGADISWEPYRRHVWQIYFIINAGLRPIFHFSCYILILIHIFLTQLNSTQPNTKKPSP